MKRGKLKTGVHPGDVEYALINELDQNKRLTFYRGG